MVTTKNARVDAIERQVERVKRRINTLQIQSTGFWPLELALLLGGTVATITLFSILHVVGIICAIAVLVAFVITLRRHAKVDKSLVRHRVWLQAKSVQLARMRLDWEEIPLVPQLAELADHPFDTDLDITGERSLHQLLNTCVSLEGTHRLQTWLLSTAPDKDALRYRQALLRELTPLIGFRDKLALHSLFVTRYTPTLWDSEKLLLWLEEQKNIPSTRLTFIIHSILSALTLLLLLGYLFLHISPFFCIAGFLTSILWFLSKQKEQANLFSDASYMRQTFGQVRVIFEYLEKYPYAPGKRLQALCEPFFEHTEIRPSRLLKRLRVLATMASTTSDGGASLFINGLLPWNSYIAYQLNTYKAQAVEYLPLWLDVWFELEALCSLANFAYLHPDYSVPEISLDSTSATHFRARGMSHPLLKDNIKVANDIAFEHSGEMLLITGSNMAGKSTFLRTMGINLCLAYAGTVVNATSFQTSLFEVYAAIKVSDSVIDGYSYFYAEVRRLKALLTRLEQEHEHPLFFLIDEIFKGTNNRERLIGSEAYIHALAGKHCIGAISTHDLELVRLSEELPEIRNYHFREDVIDGRMVFEYKIRKGPSPTTNALKIMQLEGLPITYEKITT